MARASVVLNKLRAAVDSWYSRIFEGYDGGVIKK